MKPVPIKICFIAPKAYPIFNPAVKEVFGGAEVDLYLLACQLAKDEDFNVSFITADYGQPEIENIHNVTIFKSLNFKKNPLSCAVRIWSAMEKADAQIYFQESASLGTFLVGLFCKLKNKKFIFRTASLADCNGTYLKEHAIVGKLFRWALKNSSKVIVQNQMHIENIEKIMHLTPIVIPNAHHIPPLSQGTKETILWVGRSEKIKGPQYFLDLAKQFPDEKFVMICQKATNDQNYQGLVDQAKKLNNLEFITRVDFDKIDTYFQKAKLFVNTSDSEGFPNAFIQACKQATPILSRNVNPDNFLDIYKCGICAFDDWNKFTKSFDWILKPENFSQYSKNARSYAEEKHDIIKIIEKYKFLCKNLIKPDAFAKEIDQ